MSKKLNEDVYKMLKNEEEIYNKKAGKNYDAQSR
jgi:hypothetical protein